MKDSTKGWLYVLAQFILAGIIIVSSYLEGSITNYHLSVVKWIGIILLVAGSVLILFAVFSFGQIVTPNPIPLENNKLKTGGLYKYVRHPMYFSVLVLLTGAVLYFGAIVSLIWIVVAVLFLSNKANFEERFLERKFPEYTNYRKYTKKLIPFIY